MATAESDGGTRAAAERAEAVKALEAEFGELILRTRRMMLELADRVSPGMLPGAYKILTTIERCEQVTASALTERMLIDKSQVSRAVRDLEGLGLVERTPDPTDRRSALLRLTPLGASRLAAAREPQEGLLLRTLEDWSLDDIDSLTRLLHALSSGVSPSQG